MKNDRVNARAIARLRRLLKGMTAGMFVTETPAGEFRSRPMLLQALDDHGWLWFLTDARSRKIFDLSRNPEALVTFQSPHGDRYLSIEGTAVVVKDQLRVKKLWHATYRAWYPKGKTDPEIVLLALKVSRVDYWQVPRSRLARAAGAVGALVTRKRYEAGHGTLTVGNA